MRVLKTKQSFSYYHSIFTLTENHKFKDNQTSTDTTVLKMVQAGNPQATEDLLKANLYLFIPLLEKYQNRGLPMENLFNEGVLGLIKATNYSENAHKDFAKNASWWIEYHMLKTLTDNTGHFPFFR